MVLAFAAVGAWMAPLGYAAMGWSIGSMVGSMLFPPDMPDIQGARVSDLKVQVSSYGTPIPLVWGTGRLSGNVIWSTDILETAHEEDYGKGGGGTVTTYTYSISTAIGICEAENTSVVRIWADGQVIYDASASLLPAEIVTYNGAETQLPNPTMEAYLGAGNVPAHRGLCYVVLTNFQLAPYGNRLPNLTFEVSQGAVVSTQITRAFSNAYVNFDWWNHRPDLATMAQGNLWCGYWGGKYVFDTRSGWGSFSRTETSGVAVIDPNTGGILKKLAPLDFGAVDWAGDIPRPMYDAYNNLVWAYNTSWSTTAYVYGMDATTFNVVNKTPTTVGWVTYPAIMDLFRNVTYIPDSDPSSKYFSKYIRGLGAVGTRINAAQDIYSLPAIFSPTHRDMLFWFESTLGVGLFMKGFNINTKDKVSYLIDNTHITQNYLAYQDPANGMAVDRATYYVVLNTNSDLSATSYNTPTLYAINLATMSVIYSVNTMGLLPVALGGSFYQMFYDKYRDLLWGYYWGGFIAARIYGYNPDTLELVHDIYIDTPATSYNEVELHFTSDSAYLVATNYSDVHITRIAFNRVEAVDALVADIITDVSNRCGLSVGEIDVSSLSTAGLQITYTIVTDTFVGGVTTFNPVGTWYVDHTGSSAGGASYRSAPIPITDAGASSACFYTYSDGITPTSLRYKMEGLLRFNIVVDGDDININPYNLTTFQNEDPATHIPTWALWGVILPKGRHRVEFIMLNDSPYAYDRYTMITVPLIPPIVHIESFVHATVDKVSGSIYGLVIGQNLAGRSILETLQKAVSLDAIESESKVKFVLKGQNPVVTISEAELVASSG